MLVITRKEGEGIRVGREIVVRAVKPCGGRMRIGIEAPSDVLIQRVERAEKPPVTLGHCNICGAVLDHIGPQPDKSFVSLNFSDEQVEALYYALSKLGYDTRLGELEQVFVEIAIELAKSREVTCGKE